MDNKLHNMLNELLADTSVKNDDAYEILEQAKNAKTKRQALKLAKEAYEMCPDCFDAILFQVDLEENSMKREEILNQGLEFEKERLEKEEYFDKDNIGDFYGIFETRPYMRGLYRKADNFIADGKITQARDICLEILRLNNHDNLGARYLLMAIYAYLEDEKAILKLYKKFPEENLEILFPLFAFYYKTGKNKEAKEMLKRINKANSHFIKFFQGTIKINQDLPYGYYSIGDVSEVIMYFNQYDFLVTALPNIDEFILEYSKKGKKE